MSAGDNKELIARLILQANKAQSLLVNVFKDLEKSQLLEEQRSKRTRYSCRCRDYPDSDCSLEELAVTRKRSAARRDRKCDRSSSRGRSRGHSRGRSQGRSRSRSHTNKQRKQLALAVRESENFDNLKL